MRHDDQINELKSPGMAKLSDEQLKLVKWRLEHGETITGRVETSVDRVQPSYDNFAKQNVNRSAFL